MKITRYMGAFAVIAMLAACSTDDELGANTAANEVKIAATVGGNSIFTRSNPLGTKEEQTSFNENDAVSVTTEGKTVVYKKTGEVWAPANAGDYLVWTGNAQAFEACYPEKADESTTNSFSVGYVSADQSTVDKIEKSDYMISRETIEKAYIPSDRQLTLNFGRQTARVIVKVSGFGDEFKDLNPTLSAVEVYSKLKVPAGESDSYAAIKTYKKEESGNNVFYALVSPGDANSTEKFLKLTVTYNDGEGNPTQTKELYVTGIPALDKATSYTYDVKIGKDKATIGNVSVVDWGNGDPIKGGDASTAVTVESIKESIAKQLATSNYDKNVVLTLPSNASLDLFEAINTAIKNSGVEDGTVNLYLMGVMTIPENAFNSLRGDAPGLRRVYLPDVTIIKRQAFEGNSMIRIEAPNVKEVECEAFYNSKKLGIVIMPKASIIRRNAFSKCSFLMQVSFGALSLVEGNNLDGIFNGCNTEEIMLQLSSRQAKLEFDGVNNAWAPKGQSFWDTDDYKLNSILGYRFKTITCANDY